MGRFSDSVQLAPQCSKFPLLFFYGLSQLFLVSDTLGESSFLKLHSLFSVSHLNLEFIDVIPKPLGLHVIAASLVEELIPPGAGEPVDEALPPVCWCHSSREVAIAGPVAGQWVAG